MRSRELIATSIGVTLAFAMLTSCGGTSKHAGAGAGNGGMADASGGAGASGPGGTSGASAGAGGSATAGSAGSRVISDRPQSCTTSEGDPGIMVDVQPLPEGPRSECNALAQPGEPDANCPSEDLVRCSPMDCYPAENMVGCCRPDGMCGVLETGYFGEDLALGCISRDPWIENADALGREIVPVRCD